MPTTPPPVDTSWGPQPGDPLYSLVHLSPDGSTNGPGGAIGVISGLADKTKRPKYGGYGIDPTAFQDPNAAANKANYLAAIAAAQGRGTPGQSGPFYDAQAGLISQLQAQANGTAPSLADEQAKIAQQRALAGNAALANSGDIGNPALAQRNLLNANAATSQGIAQQSVGSRLQEQRSAQEALGNVAGQGRQQDIGASLENQRQIDSLTQFYVQAGLSVDEATFAAQQALQGLQVHNALGSQATTAQANSAWDQTQAGYIGAGLNALGSAFSLAGGGVVPGSDAGHDTVPAKLRGQEVVVNPENPIYPAARAAVEGPAQMEPNGRPRFTPDQARYIQRMIYDIFDSSPEHGLIPNGSINNAYARLGYEGLLPGVPSDYTGQQGHPEWNGMTTGHTVGRKAAEAPRMTSLSPQHERYQRTKLLEILYGPPKPMNLGGPG